MESAIAIFAERGLAAPTSAISSEAGVAEGTLFAYFATKDDLLNALYREIKRDLADSMMAGFPRKKSLRERLRHVWNAYITWGLEQQAAHRVLRQLDVWGGLTAESREAGVAPFLEIKALAELALEQQILRPMPFEFLGAVFASMAEVTMETVRKNPGDAEASQALGFEILWAGVTRKK